MSHGERVAESFEQLVDLLYLPAEYPGQQRFLCRVHAGDDMLSLMCALARNLAQRVPSSQMGVHALGDLDWSSREALVISLATAMGTAAPGLAARIPRRPNGSSRYRADQHLHLLMDPPDDLPERVLTFVVAVPAMALREDMKACFYQLRALMSSSDHNWIVVAPREVSQFGEGVAEMSPFHTLFEPYDIRFPLDNLPAASG